MCFVFWFPMPPKIQNMLVTNLIRNKVQKMLGEERLEKSVNLDSLIALIFKRGGPDRHRESMHEDLIIHILSEKTIPKMMEQQAKNGIGHDGLYQLILNDEPITDFPILSQYSSSKHTYLRLLQEACEELSDSGYIIEYTTNKDMSITILVSDPFNQSIQALANNKPALH